MHGHLTVLNFMNDPQKPDTKDNRAEWFKHLTAVLLVGVAWATASIGRLVLDWGVRHWPAHSAAIERVGGWLIGLVVVLVVLLPMFFLYGMFRKSPRRERE
jgi:hypothetical protein